MTYYNHMRARCSPWESLVHQQEVLCTMFSAYFLNRGVQGLLVVHKAHPWCTRCPNTIVIGHYMDPSLSADRHTAKASFGVTPTIKYMYNDLYEDNRVQSCSWCYTKRRPTKLSFGMTKILRPVFL